MNVISVLHSAWLLNSPWWEVLTQFVMPAAAILTSGYVAIRVQRKEHATQEARRAAEAAEAAELVERKQRTALVEAEIVKNADIVQYLTSRTPELWERIRLTQSVTHHQWTMADLSDGTQVGVWLVYKRGIVVQYVINQKNPKQEHINTATTFVMHMNVLLVDWRMGNRLEEWFHDDLERLLSTEATVESEIEFNGGLDVFNRDVVEIAKNSPMARGAGGTKTRTGGTS